jgi:precorrin-6B methylase 2
MGTSEAFFDRVARRSRSKSTAPGQTATRTIAATKQHLSGDERVLDFGCGTGSLSLMVADHVASVHGVAAKRIKRVAFGLVNFRHHRVRCLLYAARPDWTLLPTIQP